MIRCGIDFGTTNSSAALVVDNQVQVLELDLLNDNASSLPSLLYVSREGEQIVGRAAANAFIERNVGREVKLEQVDLGVAIDAYVGAEPDKSEGYRPRPDHGEVREAVRALATVEVNSPGRLFHSVKSFLRHRKFTGTEVFGEHYQIEQLVSMILRPIREQIEAHTGDEVGAVVMGRPVRFSDDADEDQLAEERLRRAARIAGFSDIVFFHEPVAACIEYAVSPGKPQTLMVVDIGGGTCDVCIMEFSGSQEAAKRLSESRILAVGGIPIAGDAIDREIIRSKVFPCLGSRSRYGPSRLPMPQSIYAGITDWQSLYRLNTEDTIYWLIAVEASSTQPEAIRSLRSIIQRNYGYPIVRKVEQAKKMLSEDWEAPIEVHHAHQIDISVKLGRSEFTHIIEPIMSDMLRSIIDTERAAGLEPSQIDYVLTTGGTCLIPAVRHMLVRRYGEERLMQRDTFTSVAAGLAIIAEYL